MAKANPFRFSTKYQDDETELLYYGYRYYSASTGRWISRDPIEEEGGRNLYAFPLNAPINGIDYLGRALLSYQTTSKEPGKCGGFQWEIQWNVNQPVNMASVVQSMTLTYSPVPCPENWGYPPIGIAAGYATLRAQDMLSPFWEAWPTVTAFNGTFGSDTWQMPDYLFGDGTLGAIVVTGVASYYPNVMYNSLLNNPSWSKFHGLGSGPTDLLYTTTDPKLTGDTGFVKRTLIATWNCCCGSKDKSTKLKTIE